MTIQLAYLKFLDKVNKNSTNDGLAPDKARFVTLFNEVQNKYVEWVYEKKNEDEIRYIQTLLVLDEKLKKLNTEDYREDFALPNQFFDFTTLLVYADKGECKNQIITSLEEIKVENRANVLSNKNTRPSFEYRETSYYFGNNKLVILIDDFNISKALMTYYRYPKAVDIEGYVHVDGSPSYDIDPELDDKVVDRIISGCSKEFNQNNDDLENYQFDKDRIFSKF